MSKSATKDSTLLENGQIISTKAGDQNLSLRPNQAKRRLREVSEIDYFEFKDSEFSETTSKKQISSEWSSDEEHVIINDVRHSGQLTSSTLGKGMNARKRITMSQNYKSTIIRGFIRVALKCKFKKDGLFYEEMVRIVVKNRERNSQISGSSVEILVCLLIDYVENIGRMKSKKKKKEEKFNCSNGKIIYESFYCVEKDRNDLMVQFLKDSACELLFVFLTEPIFSIWVEEECNSSEINKRFLKENLREIRKVFMDPIHYKANFENEVQA